MKNISIFIILILVISLFIFPIINAEGSSTESIEIQTNNSESQPTNQNDSEKETGLDRAINASENRSERAKQVLEQLRLCETLDDRRERIECRLKISNRKEYKNNQTSIPETCRNLTNKDECRNLYKRVEYCYELEGRAKNKCFKRIAGFVHAKITDEPTDSEKPKKIREYISFLLYDLQEKIEKKVESGEINAERASLVINQIVEIKEDLLNNKPKSIIKPKLLELKFLVKSLSKT